MSSEVNCQHCGAANPAGSAFCMHCGKQTTASTPTPAQAGVQIAAEPESRKSPAIAAFLGVLLPGLGEMFLRKWQRGAVILILAVIVGWFLTQGYLWLLFMVISGADSYLQAKKYNQEAGWTS